jgi:predicted DNA-binding protein (MmcQ/YjbR family)
VTRSVGEVVAAHALGKPGAWADEPWDGDQVAKVGDKIFAFLGSESIGLKCGRTREEADELLRTYPDDVTVMAYIGRYGWNSVRLDGALGTDEVEELIDASYNDIVSRLPKSKRPTT